MKTLIVPTDYSPNAYHAAVYAAGLAEQIGGKLVLLHSFHLLPVVTGTAAALRSTEQEAVSHWDKLSTIALQLASEFHIQVEYMVKAGLLGDVLPEVVKQLEADLVVMGMRGISTSERLLLGSITVSVLQQATFPVLVVPGEASFHTLETILFARDYRSLSVQHELSWLTTLATAFNAQVEVLHVSSSGSVLVEIEEWNENGLCVEQALRGIPHKYNFIEDDNIIEGIVKGIQKVKPDILVMVSRKRGLFARLINPSHTRKMAFHTHIPLLVLPATN
jgi:nucleotide-binding universal stress UspA family protein